MNCHLISSEDADDRNKEGCQGVVIGGGPATLRIHATARRRRHRLSDSDDSHGYCSSYRHRVGDVRGRGRRLRGRRGRTRSQGY
jgi:hypothetical protein